MIFILLFKLIPCPIHWMVYVLAYLNFMLEFESSFSYAQNGPLCPDPIKNKFYLNCLEYSMCISFPLLWLLWMRATELRKIIQKFSWYSFFTFEQCVLFHNMLKREPSFADCSSGSRSGSGKSRREGTSKLGTYSHTLILRNTRWLEKRSFFF